MTRPNGDLIGPPRGALTIALAGNPNCGRSALFNALTGIRQKTGNWPGVTVERRLGHCRLDGREIEVVDLPGIYSFDAASLDEQVTRDYLLTREADLIVNVLDAGNLERNLYLTVQLLEMGVPLVIASAATCRRSWRRAHWQNARERKLTILMNPFMSCGARLPVYALFAAAFFPDAGQNVVFALYLVGIAVAILTGLMMKKSLLPGSSSGFMMELPPYHLPTLRAVLLRDAAATVPANLAELSRSVLDPLGLGEVRVADASAYGVDRAVFGEMHARFDGQVGAFAYLLFVLLYFPCVATIAVIRRETGGTRAAFVAAWSTLCRLPDGHGVLPGRDLQRPPAQLAGLDRWPARPAGPGRRRPQAVGAARRTPARRLGVGGVMILLRILESPARREVASLGEIACAVGSPPDAVREMLHTLARRGRVQPTAAQAVCGLGCRQCVQQDLGFDCPGGDDAK